ncbi:MAG: hypothetical protein EBU31_05900, partial [Proteobacteria bacterium]|nr:hypothetical protein [Pseudomonadota bacterium]
IEDADALDLNWLHGAATVAVTAGTPAEQPTCPRCSHALGAVPEGAWWEPLPSAVTCPECGLSVPAGAVVVSGFRHAGEAQMRGGRGVAVIVAGVAVAVGLFVTAVVLAAKGLPVAPRPSPRPPQCHPARTPQPPKTTWQE